MHPWVSQGDSFSIITYLLFEIEPLILSPSSFSRQDGSTFVLCDPERSLGDFELRSPKVKVTVEPKKVKSISLDAS